MIEVYNEYTAAGHIKLLKLTGPFTQEQLKASYKANVRFWHPDINKHPRATEVLSAINVANDYLTKFFVEVNRPRTSQNSYKTSAPRPTSSPKSPKYNDSYPAYDRASNPILRNKEELKRPTLYRVLGTIPPEIIVPKDFLKTGGTLFVMVNGSEIKFTVPANTTVAESRFTFGGEVKKVIIRSA